MGEVLQLVDSEGRAVFRETCPPHPFESLSPTLTGGVLCRDCGEIVRAEDVLELAQFAIRAGWESSRCPTE